MPFTAAPMKIRVVSTPPPPSMMVAAIRLPGPTTVMTNVSLQSTVSGSVVALRSTMHVAVVMDQAPYTSAGMALKFAMPQPATPNPSTDAQTPLPVAMTPRPLTMTEAANIQTHVGCAVDRVQPSAVGMALSFATRPLAPRPSTDAQTALPVTTTVLPLTMTEAVPTPIPAGNAVDPDPQSVAGMALPSVTHPLAQLNPSTDARTLLPVTMTVPPLTMMEAAPMHHGPTIVVVHVSPRSTVQVYVAALRSMTHAATVEEVDPRSSV